MNRKFSLHLPKNVFSFLNHVIGLNYENIDSCKILHMAVLYTSVKWSTKREIPRVERDKVRMKITGMSKIFD